MSRAENDAYWGSTDTASSALDNFFDEDSDVNWTGQSSQNSSVKSTSIQSSDDNNRSGKTDVSHSSSIIDNITSTSSSYLLSDWGTGDSENAASGASRGKLTKGVGKAIGEKLDSWKPPTVSIKWNSQGPSGDGCVLCESKNEEIAHLKKRLENSYSRYSMTLPPEDMVSRIMLGHPFSLESYRSLEDKLALIDSALAVMDSSAILVTVLHLKNTVKKSIFIKEMQSRVQAVQVYVHYLKQRYNFTEAIDFLGNLGKHEDAAILTYKWTLAGKSPSTKVKNLGKALQSHFSDPAMAFEATALKDHHQLLERQIQIEAANQSTSQVVDESKEKGLVDSSVLATLLYCCMHNWDAPESNVGSPMALRKAHNITDRQLLWTALRGRAQISHWPLPSDLEAWMGNKGVLGALTSIKSVLSGSGRVVKSTLPIDQVVYMLQSTDAPSNVLASYILLVDSLDVRLKLAVNCKSYQAVIDVYIAQKDPDSLEKYMKEIPAGSPEYLKAENALKSMRGKS
ncbi:spermatogenesis-defective protein 39 homolog [Macrobrachium rosenbergii]|uniref:spermatogenesis-defective protein 39 homolog n=1 Tax=Macrobrachium rosenbergii TaxID=79674 RepID=UPI0034D5CD8B